MKKQNLIKIVFFVALLAVCFVLHAYIGVIGTSILLLGTVDLTMDKSAIKKKGGLYWAYKRVKSDGSDLTSADTWHNGSYRRKHKFGFNQPFESDEIEDGTETFDEGKFSTVLEMLLAQDDPNVFNFLLNECGAGKYFALFIDRGKTTGGAPYRMFVPIVEIEKTGESESGSRSVQIKMHITVPTTAVTPASKPTWVNTAAGSWTCAIGAPWTLLADPAA